jgi:hypothetical protein
MQFLSKLSSFLLTICLIASGPQARVGAAAAPQDPNSSKEQSAQEQNPESQAEPEEEDLAPAAVQLDTSKDSPLIQVLYQATRETKEQPTLARLTTAKQLLDGGADVKTVDAQGRTALHWAVFGSSYSTKPKIIVAYEEIADKLIERGVELNREDAYNDTALDYLLYSPNFEMQTLLIEHGATSGFLAVTFHYFNADSPASPQSGSPHSGAARSAAFSKADLVPGATMDVRLTAPVYSDRSRTGDPVEAVVTYPLCKDGEQITCKPGELLIAPGTRVTGTVLFAQKAPDKYSRPRLVLDFSNIAHKDGQQSLLYSRVLDVDNARETVRNNEILGIVQPHASTKASIILAVAGASNPIAGYTLKGISAVYGLSIRREILFPAGTDIQIQIVQPSTLKQKEPWPGWPPMETTPKLQKLVIAAPVRTHTADGRPSDVTNLMFIGTREQIVAAFNETRWFEADSLSMGSALKTIQATIRQSGYDTGPVSSLRIDGRPPDLVFQKSLDTFAKRHHLRIWKDNATYDGREVWIGAATHDIAISNSKGKTKWSHRIDPHIDRERDWVETDLLFTGTAVGYAELDRPSVPRKTSNASGDEILTDGKMAVLDLGRGKVPNGEKPVLQTRPSR